MKELLQKAVEKMRKGFESQILTLTKKVEELSSKVET